MPSPTTFHAGLTKILCRRTDQQYAAKAPSGGKGQRNGRELREELQRPKQSGVGEDIGPGGTEPNDERVGKVKQMQADDVSFDKGNHLQQVATPPHGEQRRGWFS